MKEIWKPISGYNGLYEVSNIGRVRSKQHGDWFIMKPYVNDNGYIVYRLSNNGKSKCKRVHRLMMEAFVGNDLENPIVNHKDGNKRNNTLSNLEWSTYAKNNKHARDTGLNPGELRSKEVRAIIDGIEITERSPKRLAKRLHDLGYFIETSRESLHASIIRCCNDHSLYMGILHVEYTDDPYDIPKEYHRCGIKGRPIRAKLPSGLTVKAKGPSNLARIVQRFGYWSDVEHDKLVKAISNAALHNKSCYGIPVWYK